ncbi:MAG: MAPEG family protein [Methylovirgula sp.]
MHSAELLALELSVLLFIAHVATQGFFVRAEFDDDYLVSARDERRMVTGVRAGRAQRALANFVENYGPFAALDLGLIATGQTGGWGAMIWVIARICYLPAYLLGIPVVRSLFWVVSIIGLLMMLARLAGF